MMRRSPLQVETERLLRQNNRLINSSALNRDYWEMQEQRFAQVMGWA